MKEKRYRLKKDITIPAGTILESAPRITERFGDCYEHIMAIGGSVDTFGRFEYWMDDLEPEIKDEWFEEI